MTTSQLSHESYPENPDFFVGSLGAATLASLVLADLARRWSAGQSILISSVPLLIAMLGSAAWLMSPWRVRLPPYFRTAIGGLLAMCVWGTAVALLNDFPWGQIAAGWLAEAGAILGLLLGFGVATNETSWNKFWRAAVLIIYVSAAIAILQQFGILESDGLEMIEGAQTRRGLSTGGYFHYTSGPFRTANIFSGFLAAMGLVSAMRFADQIEQRRPYEQYLRLSNALCLLTLLICSLLAARRSGLFMFLAAVVPLLVFMPGRLAKFLTVMAVSALALLMGTQEESSTDFREKLEFATSETDLLGRFSDGVNVRDVDWALLSWPGDGIGSHGPATQGAGPLAAEIDIYLRDNHPIMHVGWFKSLLGYGPVGALLQFIWFMGLLLGLRQLSKHENVAGLASRYCGLAFGVVVVTNHYFVATSWLQSISGGLVLGVAFGTCSGRLRVAGLRANAPRQGVDDD